MYRGSGNWRFALKFDRISRDLRRVRVSGDTSVEGMRRVTGAVLDAAGKAKAINVARTRNNDDASRRC